MVMRLGLKKKKKKIIIAFQHILTPFPFLPEWWLLCCACAYERGTRDTRCLAMCRWPEDIFMSVTTSFSGHRGIKRTSFPFVMGIVTLVPINDDLTWAGKSSGPSSLCRYKSGFLLVASGTMRSRVSLMSSLTSYNDENTWKVRRGADICHDIVFIELQRRLRSYSMSKRKLRDMSIIQKDSFFKVRTHRIPILIQAQRTARMLNEQIQQSHFILLDLGHLLRHNVRNQVGSAGLSGQCKSLLRPRHG